MSASRIGVALVVVTAAAGLMVAVLGAPKLGRTAAESRAVTAVPEPTATPARPTPAPPSATPVQPTLGLEPRAAPAGAQVRLSGAGFPATDRLTLETAEQGHTAARQLGEIAAAADGQLSGALTLPVDLQPGRYVVRAHDGNGQQAETDLWVVGESARLDLRQYAAHPGETLDLAGAGFAPGEAVRVYLDDSPKQSLASLTATDRGTIADPAVPVPEASLGVHTLVAEGGQTGLVVRREFSVVGYTPWMVLSTYALRPGGAVDVSGQEFAPGEDVQVVLDDAASPAQTLKAGADGAVAVRSVFAAKPQDVGKHRLTLVGGQTRAPTTATFEVLPFVPRLALTTYAGPPGTRVAFDGEGFAPGETVRAYLDRGGQREQVALFQAAADGAFQGAGAYAVPGDAPAGKLRFVVVGDLSKVPVSQDFGVQAPNPSAQLSEYAGPAGAQVRFRGLGFAPGEQVEAHLGGASGPVLGTATADQQGSVGWAGPVALPAGQSGSLRLVLVGAASRAQVEATYDAAASGPGDNSGNAGARE